MKKWLSKWRSDWSASVPACNERASAKKSLKTLTPQIINIFSRRNDAQCNRDGLRSSRFTFLLLVSLFFAICFVQAQSGVLLPVSTNKTDIEPLEIQTMNVSILIDDQHATVKIVQIFDNRTSETLEGKYLFALPTNSSIFDFAVWDADVRIPGVMMEKRRANQIYGEIKQKEIDPGILQQTDETESETAFSAKIFPIPAYGTKRLEMEYTETLSVENLAAHFSFPLKPSFGEKQTVKELFINVRVLNNFQFFPQLDQNFPLQVSKNEPNEFEANFHGENVELNSDFSFDYKINTNENALSFITYRAPEQISAYDLRDPKTANKNADGYFQTQAILGENQLADKNETAAPRRIVLLLDTSLSMYGDKISRTVESADYFLHGLRENDEFNLILFNSEISKFATKPLSATNENVENALVFLRNSTLGGGTNLKLAFETAIEQSKEFSGGQANIVLVSDANPTLETVDLNKLIKLFSEENAPKFFAFGIGNDAETTLLKEISEKTKGYFAQARETEDISFLLENFFSKIGQPSVEKLRFDASDLSNFYNIYATNENSFGGSSFGFVGRYKNPQEQTNIGIKGEFGANEINFSRAVSLPEFDDVHKHLPRVWARARIDALLREMNLNGEREDYISEIINLSEKYKLVTPYTAFLAAPRALLRPRLIQPGDPVIRVKTDDSITEVFAVLPFGETLKLTFLPDEKIWQTRFLAPAWMPDGTYKCRLLLTDKDGNGFEEAKTFVIDSSAPKPKIELPKTSVRAGEDLKLRVASDKDTMRLVAKFYGAKPVRLAWSNEEKTNVGTLKTPNNLPSGKYVLTVTAEDFAHNQTSEEIAIEILN